MIRTISSDNDFKELLVDSRRRPVFLVKHSTACPVSANAWAEVGRFEKAHPEAGVYAVLVIESQGLSTQIAASTGIAHQSPQYILFRDGKPVFHDSHWRVNQEEMETALTRGVEQPGP
jgi:bacillithiol system protein YtxJ